VANQVYANNMEISCKAAAGKSICAFPDVCFTPPTTPATPPGVPIPYPNTGMASDATSGSTSVKISGQEVMLKNKSYFKRSMGDEAGCAPKKGVVSSVNMGKVYYTMWSMDVKIEGENVDRMLDLTTHNHASQGPNSPPWPYIDEVAVPGITAACKKDSEREAKACGYDKKSGQYTKSADECCKDKACQQARKCKLTPYAGKSSPNCCPPQVAHHIFPNSLLQGTRGDSSTNVPGLRRSGKSAYTLEGAPCVCCSGRKGVSNPIGTHKRMHDLTKKKLKAILTKGGTLTADSVKAKIAEAHAETFKDDDGKPLCNPACIEAQIEVHMQKAGTGAEIKPLQKDGATAAKYDKYKTGKAK
jgi:hypothetical protein